MDAISAVLGVVAVGCLVAAVRLVVQWARTEAPREDSFTVEAERARAEKLRKLAALARKRQRGEVA